MGNKYWSGLDDLILVAGHAVYVGHNNSTPDKDDNWCLQSFQQGEPPSYIVHIKTGVDFANRDKKSLLVFSGGQTRFNAGPRSEGQSYWNLADHFGWWGNIGVKSRATTEEYALDSFQNVLFGICRFYECTGKYPRNITIISWSFKEERFNLHLKTILYPQKKTTFVGVNNPIDLDRATTGESKAINSFKSDPFGMSEELSNKRIERNPFNRFPPYSVSCSELMQLLSYKGPSPYFGKLPWVN